MYQNIISNNLTKFLKSSRISIKTTSFNYNISDIYTPSIIAYKIIENTITDITNLLNFQQTYINNDVEIVNGNITLPDEDCVVLYIFNNIPNIIQVGSPKPYIYYYSTLELNDRVVQYKSFDPENILISQGVLSHIGFGVFCKNVSTLNYCILDIDDNTSFGIDNSQTFYFNVSNDVSNTNTGIIVLQPSKFQMVAIPNKDKDISYFLDLVQAELIRNNSSLRVQDVILLTKAYPSTHDVFNKYQVYVPGSSGEASKFKLMIYDASNTSVPENDRFEINPFFVKTGSFGSLQNITINWSS